MYQRILSSIEIGPPIHHWGDVDEGGFRIAAALANASAQMGHGLKPYSMHPESVSLDSRRPASKHTAQRMEHFAEQAGWSELAKAVLSAGVAVEQEAF